MYISSIQIDQLRCYETANLTLEHAGSDSVHDDIANVTLLLGNNGAGKTTVLKSIALAVLGPVIQDSGYKPECLIRRTDKRNAKSRRKAEILASIVFHGQDQGVSRDFTRETAAADASARVVARGSYERVTADFQSTQGPAQASERTLDVDRLFDDESPAYFIVGYGATRRVASPKSSDLMEDRRRGLRYQRVAGLFEDYVTLWPMKLWLPELKQKSAKRHKEVVALISDLLPDDITFAGEFEELQPVFTHRGIDLPFTALSDGYRGFIGLIADLLYHLHDVCPKGRKLIDMTGIVLIDDVDLHLHPAWQRLVIGKLCSTLSKLQFIVTSHSPLVAGTLFAKNIRVVESPTKGPSSINQIDERIHGLNSDQVLTSSYFGLRSTRSPEQVRKLGEMADAVARRGDPAASIAFLRELTGKESE